LPLGVSTAETFGNAGILRTSPIPTRAAPEIFTAARLDGFAILCAYERRNQFCAGIRRCPKDLIMSSLRSHAVAKAAAALPFIRSCEWSRVFVTNMSMTMQGLGYPEVFENLGHLDPTGIAHRA
jgi:hypothetical protein